MAIRRWNRWGQRAATFEGVEMEWRAGGAEGLTVGGAARGAVAGAVAHFDALPPHLQQSRVGDASLAGVAEALLVMAAVVGDVDGRPGRPGRGLLQVGAGQGVARLVLLQQRWSKLQTFNLKNSSLPEKGIFLSFAQKVEKMRILSTSFWSKRRAFSKQPILQIQRLSSLRSAAPMKRLSLILSVYLPTRTG